MKEREKCKKNTSDHRSQCGKWFSRYSISKSGIWVRWTLPKGSSTPTKMRKTSNRQIQYNVEDFDKIHASSASVRNWSSQ